MRFKLVEPLRELFKDEVRVVGTTLGLDDEFVWRQPFPGPGLAVRLLGPLTRERLDLLRRADAVVVDEIRKAGWYRRVWQSFAVLVAGPERRRDGGWPHLRVHRRHSRCGEPGWDDGRLGAAAARAARGHLLADCQRGPRHQSRGLRHQFETSGHDRMGVGVRGTKSPAVIEVARPAKRRRAASGGGAPLAVNNR